MECILLSVRRLPAHISGKADPDPATLSGSLTRVDKHTGAGIITTRIYTWDLRR